MCVKVMKSHEMKQQIDESKAVREKVMAYGNGSLEISE